MGCIKHAKVTGTCKYSCKTIGYCLRTIVNIYVIFYALCNQSQMFTGHPSKGTAGVCLMEPLPNQTLVIPRETRLINLSGRSESPHSFKPREFERKIYLYNTFL